LKFFNTQVFNFEGALRGMRNPMNSWDKSDSEWRNSEFYIGKNDLKLAQSLISAGSDHSKFMRQIFVSVDITAPIYWWKEFDTYKVGTVANSTSTMHKLATTPITPDCFEFDSVTEMYATTNMRVGEAICKLLESYREEYLRTKDKRVWRALIQLLPSSWLQTRTITMSYQNVRAMCFARENHKLSEWSIDFFELAKSLPYYKELIVWRGSAE